MPAPDDLLDSPFEPIEDYGVIGDCRTAALVSRMGSIDWLCLPQFASPSVFAALLDREKGGRYVVRPREVLRVTREYWGESNVLRTVFHCREGRLCLTDAMTVLGEEAARRELQPQHELLRVARCEEGRVTLDVAFQMRPDYGRATPRFTRRGRLGWLCTASGLAVFLYGDLELAPLDDRDAALGGSGVLEAGEEVRLVLSYSDRDMGTLAPVEDADLRLRQTVCWWETWAARCTYTGRHRDRVVRSCLTLKLLAYHLSGAVVAAATTSLPEEAGGGRNWDYRYCWLRDASMLLQSFSDMGFADEAEAFLGWLLHATRLTQPRLEVLYDVHGNSMRRERTLDHLAGYGGQGPVRVGNSAGGQVQHDVYGQVLLTARRFVEQGGELDVADRRLLVGFGEMVRSLWDQPDHGIWEIRLPCRHNTHSKLMCWVALDSLLHLHERIDLDIDEAAYRAERERIREDIEARGFNPGVNSYVGFYGSEDPDASLLLMPRYGYVSADDPRMVGTWRHIEARLSHRGLLFRYPPGPDYDGVEGEENLFAICNFWLVDYLARLGEQDKAQALFDRLCELSNDLGLYAEEFDRESLGPMGNFPQAFSHEGLITAALALAEGTGAEREEA